MYLLTSKMHSKQVSMFYQSYLVYLLILVWMSREVSVCERDLLSRNQWWEGKGQYVQGPGGGNTSLHISEFQGQDPILHQGPHIYKHCCCCCCCCSAILHSICFTHTDYWPNVFAVHNVMLVQLTL